MKQMLRGMAKTKIPRQMTLQVLAEDQSTKEQLEAELKHHQGTNKFRMPDLKLIRQELEEWLQGIESKKIALHSLINQITVYANAALKATYNAGYLTNQTRALDYTPWGQYPRCGSLSITSTLGNTYLCRIGLEILCLFTAVSFKPAVGIGSEKPMTMLP